MDYSISVAAMITFIEARIQTKIIYPEMEKAMHMSLSHMRAIFQKHTGLSLSQYIRERKIAYCAFDLVHGKKSILEIALQYGFTNPDTFTRAFRSVTGITPQQFRKEKRPVGRIQLYNGMYGISEKPDSVAAGYNTASGNMVLYGVPKVGYGTYGVTPYPICLKATANYLGIAADYNTLMVECGGAFRLTWDVTALNGGNVDISHTFSEPNQVYRSGVESLGRRCEILERSPHTTKGDFQDFIKKQIDSGRPCIAKGIIGPPESCIITGYQENSQVLLGWNFFQNSVPFGDKEIQFDPCGYFICRNWWENPYTTALIGISEESIPAKSLQEILIMAATTLQGGKEKPYWKGLFAYDAWKNFLQKEENFTDNYILLTEGFLCHADAVDALADGRTSAMAYFGNLAKQNPGQPLYRQIAHSFGIIVKTTENMAQSLGGWLREEAQILAFQHSETRQQLCHNIEQCMQADKQALKQMTTLAKELH